MNTKHILLLLTVCLLCSCSGMYQSAIGQSKYTIKKVEAGMTKEAIIELYGTPFKESFVTMQDMNYDMLYYKEVVGTRYILNIIFRFVDNKLISQEQGKEEIIGEGCSHDSSKE